MASGALCQRTHQFIRTTWHGNQNHELQWFVVRDNGGFTWTWVYIFTYLYCMWTNLQTLCVWFFQICLNAHIITYWRMCEHLSIKVCIPWCVSNPDMKLVPQTLFSYRFTKYILRNCRLVIIWNLLQSKASIAHTLH